MIKPARQRSKNCLRAATLSNVPKRDFTNGGAEISWHCTKARIGLFAYRRRFVRSWDRLRSLTLQLGCLSRAQLPNSVPGLPRPFRLFRPDEEDAETRQQVCK